MSRIDRITELRRELRSIARYCAQARDEIPQGDSACLRKALDRTEGLAREALRLDDLDARAERLGAAS